MDSNHGFHSEYFVVAHYGLYKESGVIARLTNLGLDGSARCLDGRKIHLADLGDSKIPPPIDGLGRGRPPVDECELRAPVLGRQAEISIFFGLTRNGMKFMVFSFRAVISGTRASPLCEGPRLTFRIKCPSL